MSKRYRAFICYSQQDNREAARLHRRIESFQVPKRLRGTAAKHGPVPASLAPVFRDREELAASANIGERLQDALANSDFLIVLCSPAAAQSHWVNAEIETFCALAPGNRERVLAILLAGEPACSDARRECFPPTLVTPALGAAGLTARYPLAADFRPGKDRRADAELRLFAALLGVEFDLLKQRDQERRLKRLRLALIASFAVMASSAALAGYALLQREEAKRSATREAEAAERAQSARVEAEKLVDFMLTDLRPRLELIGRLDLLEPANGKIRAYYEAVAPMDLDADAIGRRGSAFHAHAVDLRSRKRGSKTMEVLLTAVALRRRVTELRPGHKAGWLDRAETHRFLALQRRDDGNIPGALGEIGAARRFIDKALELEAGDRQAAARRAGLGIDEADLLVRSGRAADAIPTLQRTIAELTELANRPPADSVLKNRTSGAMWQLGNVLRRSGDFAAAERHYREALSISEALVREDPTNIFFLRQNETVSGSIGQLMLEAGRHAEAVAQLQLTMKLSRAVSAVDPGSLVYQDALATQLANLAEAQVGIGQLEEAKRSIIEAVHLREAALAAGATDTRTHTALAYSLGTQSRIESLTESHTVAVASALRGAELMEKLVASAPSDVRLGDDLAFLRSRLAEARLRSGNFNGALEAFSSAVAQIDSVIAREPSNPQLTRQSDRARWRLGIAKAFEKLSRHDDARVAAEECLAVLARLEGMGLDKRAVQGTSREARELLARTIDRRQ